MSTSTSREPQVKPCGRTPYETEQRAKEVIHFMKIRGAYPGKLRIIKCNNCRLYHLEYVR